MIPFEEALLQGGSLVAAWDDLDDARRGLALFTVGPGGAALTAHTRVDPSKHEEMTDRLLDRGLRIGRTYGDHEFVWALDGPDPAVWSGKGIVWQATPPRPVVRVVTFLDPADRGHRGVRLLIQGGADVTVAEERDETPALDPFYNSENLFLDTLWAHYLGYDLAQGLSVPHENQVSSIDNAEDLAIARAARSLADEIERLSSSRTFEPLVRSLGPLTLRFAPGSLELRVATSTRRIRQGPNARIAGFLREVRAPISMRWTMNEMKRETIP